MNDLSVEVMVLENRYTNFSEAYEFVCEAQKAIGVALKSAVRYAETVQECEMVCKKTAKVNPIHKDAIEKMSKVGRIQIEKVQTIIEAIEIKDIATHDSDLQSLAVYKAIDLMEEFKDVYLVIDHLIPTDYDIEEYFWKRALEIAHDYEDFDLIISKSPKSLHTRWIKKAASLKQGKIMKKLLANSSLEELGELFYNSTHRKEKSLIRNKYSETFSSKFNDAKIFSEYRKLFELYEKYGKLTPSFSDKTFLEPMLRLAESFVQAKFIYEVAIDRKIRTLAMALMCNFTESEVQKKIAMKKPEFKIVTNDWPQWLNDAHFKVFEGGY